MVLKILFIFIAFIYGLASGTQINGNIIIPFIHYDRGTYISVGEGYGVIIREDGKVIYRVGNIDFWEVLGKPSAIKLLNEAKAKVSIFKGKPSTFKIGLKSYKELILSDVYKGVDVIFKANSKGIEKLYVFKKGVDPKKIRFFMEGGVKVGLSKDGGLFVKKGEGLLYFSRPKGFQIIDGRKVYVDVYYEVGEGYYAFKVGNYSKEYDLIIDPMVAGTFLGGVSHDEPGGRRSIAVDGSGNIYVVGFTKSWDFPTDSVSPPPETAGGDAFVIKVDPTFSSVLAVAFVGGSGMDIGKGVVVDPSGNVVVSIQSSSSDAPVSNNAFQQSKSSLSDVYIAKLSSDLQSLISATYYGGSGEDEPLSLTVDSAGNIYVVGRTSSPDLFMPISAYDGVCNAGGTTCSDGFLVKFNSNLSEVVGATYVGGPEASQVNDIAVDTAGNIYVVGSTGAPNSCNFPGTTATSSGWCGFIAKFDPSISSISSRLTGQEKESANVIKIDSSGNLVVAGITQGTPTSCYYDVSTDQVVCKHDIFVKTYDTSLNEIASIFIGGRGQDNVMDIDFDSAGNIYIVGYSDSFDLQTFPSSFQYAKVNVEDTLYDAFIASISSDLSQILATTYLGGCRNDFATSIMIYNDDIYVAGKTDSPNFPATQGSIRSSYTFPEYPYTVYDPGVNDVFLVKLTKDLSRGTDPRISESLCVWDFGIYNVGNSSPPKEVRIYNFGGSDLIVNSLTLDDKTNFSIDLGGGSNPCNQLPVTIPPSSYCSFNIIFTPQADGIFEAILTVQSNDPVNSSRQIFVKGVGKGPKLQVYPNPIDFGPVGVGSSASQIVNVRNGGNLDLVINSIQIVGDNVFSITSNNCSGITLAPNSSCDFVISFSPTSLQNYSATITIYSNDPSSPTDVQVTGIGAPNEPDISVTPMSYDFGNVFVGANKVFSSVVVQNNGLVDLTISDVSISGSAEFRVNYTTCIGASIPPRGSCIVDLLFKPQSVGQKNASLDITSNDPDTPTVSVSLTGTGVPPPVINVNPTSIDFGNVMVNTSVVRTITISNTGSADLEITYVGNISQPVSIAPGQTNPCPANTPFVLAPNQSCTYDLTFAPTQPGSISMQLLIRSNDPVNGYLYVSITGNAILSDAPVIYVDPTSVDFGVKGVGTRTQPSRITVSNLGSKVLSISSVTLSGNDFVVITDICTGANLNAGDVCYIDVVFSPTTLGTLSGSITINSNDPLNPSVVVTLTGEGIYPDPTIFVDPALYDFGDTSIGYPKHTTITVKNMGEAPLMISSVTLKGNDKADFEITNDTCTNNALSYGMQCLIDVRFNPQSVGKNKSAFIEISSNDPVNGIVNVNLSGNALPPPIIVVDPNIIDFGVVPLNTSKQIVVKVTNASQQVAVVITDVRVEGTNIGEFDALSTCSVLNPQDSCNITVSFTPVGEEGDRKALLVIYLDNGDSIKVQILGYATGGSSDSLYLPAKLDTIEILDFGKRKVNIYTERDLLVKNVGDDPLVVLRFAWAGEDAGEFGVVEDMCSGKTLKKGESCYFTLGFVPSREGNLRANFLVYWKGIYDTEEKEHLVIVRGTGAVNLFGCSAGSSYFAGYIILFLITKYLSIHFLSSIKRNRKRDE